MSLGASILETVGFCGEALQVQLPGQRLWTNDLTVNNEKLKAKASESVC